MQAPRATVFDLDRFLAECQAARAQSTPEKAMREVVRRAVSDPAAVLRGLGEPKRAGINALYRSAELTILDVVWGPKMTLMPHDHRLWAVVGVYTGREDNIFWRRIPGEQSGKIEAAGAHALGVRDTVPLGRDLIHSVTNPIPRLTGAIHVYGGDFFTVARSEWDPETLIEQPYDVQRALRTFEEANAGSPVR
jgi:predicted metal-dependent enzyme (double-stranded beta helix superfamily)